MATRRFPSARCRTILVDADPKSWLGGELEIHEIPGKMGRGNWKAAAYVDERASDKAYEGLLKIFTGQARGTTGLFKVLVSEFLGAERAPVTYETEGKTRRLTVGRAIKGEVAPVAGKGGEDIVVFNIVRASVCSSRKAIRPRSHCSSGTYSPNGTGWRLRYSPNRLPLGA